MAKYTGNILTNLGKDLLARAVIGGEVITFTKVELGKGVIVGGSQEEFTELIDSFKVLPITSTAKLEGGSYRVRAAFSNSGIVEDTYLREIGVFARGEDGVEILYSYCNTDTPDLIPAEGAGVLERVEDIITYTSNATNVNAVIDQSKVYATIKDLTEGLAEKEDKFLKNSGFNLDKSDSYSLNDSNKLATSKALKDGLSTTFKTSDCYYGIGDYWLTESNDNPAVKWPGTTWSKVENRLLIGASGSYVKGSQGGNSNISLSSAHLPSHNHSFSATTNTTGNHNHKSGNHRHRVDSHAHTQPSHSHKQRLNGPDDSAWKSNGKNVSGTYHSETARDSTLNTGSAGGENTGGATPYTDYQNPTSDTKGNHSHTVSGTIGSSGSGSSFSILNPYRAVNIWRRTA